MNAKELAAKIADRAKEYGCSIEIRGSIVTVTKRFTPSDKSAYALAETDVGIILGMVPTTSAGSTWGTDGLSIGGAVGLQNGYMKMNKSGGSVRVINALKKIA
jgi:hypothetical protein